MEDKLIDKLQTERENRVKKFLQEMETFKTVEDIHGVPKFRSKEDYQEYVVKNFIRCGAIPKKDLIVGETYLGNCRNAYEATWNGEYFTYNRYKFGILITDTINHFEDDDGYDLFVPLFKK
jgi:hypothetical protein